MKQISIILDVEVQDDTDATLFAHTVAALVDTGWSLTAYDLMNALARHQPRNPSAIACRDGAPYPLLQEAS